MFHPMSLLIPFMVLLPNLIFFRLQPRNRPADREEKENTLLSAAEGIGQVGVFIVPLFSSIHIEHFHEVISLIGMVLFLTLYYVGWIRYFRRDREYKLLFSSMIGIPVPLAISPIIYFLFASVVLHSSYLFICNVIFAIGHIPISLFERRKCDAV